jgi:hypothetical protein
MIYGEIGEMAAFALGGFALGTMYGRKLASDVSALVQSLELRVTAIERAAGGNSGAAAVQANAHAAALEKLAGAIEKHAAAIDDHGAATVAAAVESSAVSPAAQ